jgi:hypothetical protein
MTHFIVLVITKDDQDPEDLLAPYDEDIAVIPYEEDCFCLRRNLQNEIDRRRIEKFGGNFEEKFREPYHELPEDSRPEWKDYIKPWTELGDKLEQELEAEYKRPSSQCEHCQGTGKVLSQYNPNSKWDWFSLGGRGLGFMKLKEGKTGKLGEPGVFGNEAKQGYADQAKAKDIELAELERPFAFITSDGIWHEQAKMGWWGMTSQERKEDYVKEWAEAFKNLDPEDLLSAYDCHI